jgi:hypothetical protein
MLVLSRETSLRDLIGQFEDFEMSDQPMVRLLRFHQHLSQLEGHLIPFIPRGIPRRRPTGRPRSPEAPNAVGTALQHAGVLGGETIHRNAVAGGGIGELHDIGSHFDSGTNAHK